MFPNIFSYVVLFFQAKQRGFALEQRNRELASTQSKQVQLQLQMQDVSVFFFIFMQTDILNILIWCAYFLQNDLKNEVAFISSILKAHSTLVCLQDLLVFLPVGSPLSLSSSIPSSLAATPPSPAPQGPPGTGCSSGMNANALPFYPTSETVESVVGKWRCKTIPSLVIM